MTHPIKKNARSGIAICVLPAIFCALLSMAPQAQAAYGGRYAACPACAPQDLAWSDGEFDQVNLVADTSGGGNLHPQTIPLDVLTKALLTVRYREPGGMVPLLDEEGASNLAHGITKAIAKASPGQEAIFLMTSKMSGGLFGVKLGNSGRVFVDRNGLNIIVGEAHVEFVAAYRATRMERPFNFGSRSRASVVVLETDGLKGPRNDWIILPLATGGANAQQAQKEPVAAVPVQPVVRDEQYYSAQETRLKGLKRVREQNLITEEEYQAKKVEILKAW